MLRLKKIRNSIFFFKAKHSWLQIRQTLWCDLCFKSPHVEKLKLVSNGGCVLTWLSSRFPSTSFPKGILSINHFHKNPISGSISRGPNLINLYKRKINTNHIIWMAGSHHVFHCTFPLGELACLSYLDLSLYPLHLKESWPLAAFCKCLLTKYIEL